MDKQCVTDPDMVSLVLEAAIQPCGLDMLALTSWSSCMTGYRECCRCNQLQAAQSAI